MDNEIIERCAKALWDNDQNKPYVKYGFSNGILFGQQWHGKAVPWEYITGVDVVPMIAQEWRDKAILVIKELSLIIETEVKNLKDDECIIHENCHTCDGHVEGMQNILKAILNAK